MLQEEGTRTRQSLKTVQEELADFYRRHDPTKVEKVDRLFEKFSFDDIRASVMRKYGSLPKGWSNDTIQLDVKVASSEQVRDWKQMRFRCFADIVLAFVVAPQGAHRLQYSRTRLPSTEQRHPSNVGFAEAVFGICSPAGHFNGGNNSPVPAPNPELLNDGCTACYETEAAEHLRPLHRGQAQSRKTGGEAWLRCRPFPRNERAWDDL
jgi:hypothetical protein